MPWWAITYLLVLTAVILISVIKDFRDRQSPIYIVGELASGSIGFIFILGYWHPELISILSWLVLPALCYIIVWDQYALKFMKASNYPDLTEKENKDMDRYSKVFAMIFILPCYIAGVLLSWQLLN